MAVIGTDVNLAVVIRGAGSKILEKVMAGHEEYRDAQQNHVEDLEAAHASDVIQEIRKTHDGGIGMGSENQPDPQENQQLVDHQY